MASNAHQCFVCSAQFSSADSLRSHVWNYQNEVAQLLARLQSLLAHCGSRDDVQDTNQIRGRTQLERRGRRKDQWQHVRCAASQTIMASPELVEGPRLSPQHEQRPSRQRRSVKDGTPFNCPYLDCQSRFTRPQDLERHYIFHLDCDEYCHYCRTTYTRADKYIRHKCALNGPDNQRDYIKRRSIALRNESKRNLALSRSKSDCDSHVGPSRAIVTTKRPRLELPVSSGEDDAQPISEQTSTSFHNSPPRSNQPSPSTHFLASSANRTIMAAASQGVSPNLPWFGSSPLYLPPTSAWPSELQHPAPLWSLPPAFMDGPMAQVGSEHCGGIVFDDRNGSSQCADAGLRSAQNTFATWDIDGAS